MGAESIYGMYTHSGKLIELKPLQGHKIAQQTSAKYNGPQNVKMSTELMHTVLQQYKFVQDGNIHKISPD